MGRLPIVDAKTMEMEKVLIALEFQKTRQKESHAFYPEEFRTALQSL